MSNAKAHLCFVSSKHLVIGRAYKLVVYDDGPWNWQMALKPLNKSLGCFCDPMQQFHTFD